MKVQLERREFMRLGAGAIACVAAPLGFGAAAEKDTPWIDAAVRRINALASLTNDGFVFITDLHVDANHRQSGALIAELIRRTPLRKILCGGDVGMAFSWSHASDRAAVQFAASEFAARWITPIEQAGGDLFTARGNHDFSTGKGPGAPEGYTLSNAETRAILMGSRGCQRVVRNPSDPDACYYYFDSPQTRFRYVVVDTTDSTKGEPPHREVVYGIGSKQLKWIAENALMTVPKDHCVVVMHHVPICQVTCAADVELFYTPFRSILEAYQNRTRVTAAGMTFDFAKAQGRIVLDICGHTHAERQTWRNGILYVTEPCDAAYGDYIVGSQPWCGELPKKAKDSPFAQTFDAVQIDVKRDIVHFTRIGGGKDRMIHFRARKVAVGQRIRLEPTCLGRVCRWACYDGGRIAFSPDPNNRWGKIPSYFSDVATISASGELQARQAGVVIAMAYDADGNREIMPIQCDG